MTTVRDQWDNHNGENYRIEIPGADPAPIPAHALKRYIRQKETEYEQVHAVDGPFQLAVAVNRKDAQHHIILITDIPGPLILHWGLITHLPGEWILPPTTIRPAGSTVFQDTALESPFHDVEGLRQLQIKISEQEPARAISFVLRYFETDHWIKDQGHNFHIPLSAPAMSGTLPDDLLTMSLADHIIGKEMGGGSWTLMHRFNLCHDLLDRIEHDDIHALSLIFVWLRFSAIRQLVWQRNYNTKPSELSHAQDRLTSKLAQRYLHASTAEAHLIRLILSTLGRGGEGQRVRDGILNIMHRHHIKEVSGHFMEEWHQKLHNNTTPDDVVICEAFLAFTRENGNLDLFYKVLEKGGVTKKRMETYDRPIRSHPDFIPHLKEALIHDFEDFLGILKSVHSGTDLGTAIYTARPWLDQALHGLMDHIWQHRDDGAEEICGLVEQITEARRLLKDALSKPSKGIRDLLSLDIALEDFLRIAVERDLHVISDQDPLVDLIYLMIENRFYTDDDIELIHCRRHWDILRKAPRNGRIWSIQAQAVIERLGRFMGTSMDRFYNLLQPKAEFLGKAFQADSWSIGLFTEEVVRGRPAFVLVMLLRRLNPLLRKNADLGSWQVVSRGRGIGRVEVSDNLGAFQGRNFDGSTIIVTDKITGNEDIPLGVTAIITPDTTDIVSHVAIRARNSNVLIATCYDPDKLADLKALRGDFITLDVTPAGEVLVEKGTGQLDQPVPPKQSIILPLSMPRFTDYAIPENDFNGKNVGAKSNHLRRLQEALPAWVKIPGSMALPFCVFEKVLAETNNRGVAKRHEKYLQELESASDDAVFGLLKELKKTVAALNAPDKLKESIYKVTEGVGLPWPKKWDDAWECIKQVWASKWNKRAFLSRKALGIPHNSLFMAVLIQQMVDAAYAFVIHTKNPFTGDDREIYGEVVLGLGETLVGNFPGRALGFTLRKGEDQPQIRAFPSKSIGLFGGGLIFRSDSNGEDLAGYAGAGLYDSVTLTPPREVVLDYATEPLVWDNDFQRILLTRIAKIGTIIENHMGSPQDIEGACAKGEYYVVQTRPQI